MELYSFGVKLLVSTRWCLRPCLCLFVHGFFFFGLFFFFFLAALLKIGKGGGGLFVAVVERGGRSLGGDVAGLFLVERRL